MPEQRPVAEGSIAETPFGHLAIYLYRRTANGTLLVTTARGDSAQIRFQQGRATALRLSFYAQNLFDGLLPLCGLTEGQFEFFDADLLRDDEEALVGDVDPYALLCASLQDHARDDMVDAVLERYRNQRMRLQPGRDLDRLGLKPNDKPLIELLRAAPATPPELVDQSQLPKPHTRRLLYALIVTHMLSPHEQRNAEIYKSQVSPSSGRPAFNNVNDVAVPPTRAWQLLASLAPGQAGPRAASLRPGQASSARPGVALTRPNGTPPNGTAAAPVAEPKRSLTPPRASGRPITASGPAAVPPANTGGRPITASGPAAMPPPRMSGRPITASGPAAVPPPPTPARETAQTSAADQRMAQVRKLDQLLQRSRIDEALALVDELLASSPDRPELLALKGHALFEKHRNDSTGLPRSVVEVLRRALELDAEQVRAAYVRGLVFQHAGEAKKALAAFKRVLQIDPKHLEAQRAVRLLKLRETS